MASLIESDRQNIYSLIFKACKLLSSLSMQVQEQAAWKLVHPKTRSDIKEKSDKNFTSYELAVQYNYDADEKKCLLDVS